MFYMLIHREVLSHKTKKQRKRKRLNEKKMVNITMKNPIQ